MVPELENKPILSVDIGRLQLKNPVMTASGTFGYGKEYEQLVDLNRLGAVVVKGLSLEPTKGNLPPRIVETPSGMLNAIGLENIGIDAFEQEKLPFLKGLEVPVILNMFGRTIDEYAELASRINRIRGVSGIEVNISCPNIEAGGIAFGVDPEAAYAVISAVRAKTTLPVMAKLSPNVTDIAGIARRVEDAGADGISLINTLMGMAIDVDTRRPKLANITGGLSGPAIRPIALRMVWQVAQAVNLPVIGIGGIMSAEDALAFLIVGAKAVQVGTANFVNPRATMDILDGIEAYLEKNKICDIKEIVNSVVI